MLRALMIVSFAVVLAGCGRECFDDGSGWHKICRDDNACYFDVGGIHYNCKSCDDCRSAADGVAGYSGGSTFPLPPLGPPPNGPYDTFESRVYLFWNLQQSGPDACKLGLPVSTFTNLDVSNDHKGGIAIGSTGVPGFADRSVVSYGTGRMSDPTHGMTSMTVSDTPGFDSDCSFILHREVRVTVEQRQDARCRAHASAVAAVGAVPHRARLHVVVSRRSLLTARVDSA